MRKKKERADFNRYRGDMLPKTEICVKNEDTLKKFWWYRAVFVPLWAKLMFNPKHRHKKKPEGCNPREFYGCFILQKFGDRRRTKINTFMGAKLDKNFENAKDSALKVTIALRKKNKYRWFGYHLASMLYYQNPDSSLRTRYENSFHCCEKLYQGMEGLLQSTAKTDGAHNANVSRWAHLSMHTHLDCRMKKSFISLLLHVRTFEQSSFQKKLQLITRSGN